MHDKNGAMCFVPVFCIGLRVGREHSEAVLTVFGSSNNILLSKDISVIFLSYKPEIFAGQVWASGISWTVKSPCYIQFLLIIGNEGPGKNISRETQTVYKEK